MMGGVPDMHFIKYLMSLLREMFQFALEHKVWWVLPVVVVLLSIGLLIIVGETSAPFIYTLF